MSIVEEMQKIPGWLSIPQAETLLKIADDHLRPGGFMVEVGVWKGRSGYVWGKACLKKEASLIGVDTFTGTVGWHDPEYDGFSSEDWYNETSTNVSGLPVKLIKSDSLSVAKRFQDHTADIVYIDGDHSYFAVWQDIGSYLYKIRPGGVLCGHDYQNPEVAQAVNLLHDVQVENDIWIIHR